MTIKINDKEFKFDFKAQIGPYYHYEVQFGTSFQDDLQIFSPSVPMIRLIYSVLLTDNAGFPMTFDEFVGATTDELIAECSKFLEQRFNVLAQEGKKEETTETKEDGKKD